jgi:hypothetical protein
MGDEALRAIRGTPELIGKKPGAYSYNDASAPRAGALADLAKITGREDVAREALFALPGRPAPAWLPVLARLATVVEKIPTTDLAAVWRDLLSAGAEAKERGQLLRLIRASIPLLRALGDPHAADTVAEEILNVTEWIP